MNVTVVGGGNIGTQIAAHAASVGCTVTVYSSKPNLFSSSLDVVDENGDLVVRGENIVTTDNKEKAFLNAQLIFITYPSFCFDYLAGLLEPYVGEGMKLCIVPGTGGAEFAFSKCVLKGCSLWGLQRAPSVARLVEYGRMVCAVGYRKELHVASIPHNDISDCISIIRSILNMDVVGLPNYLNITLTPSNPVLHTSRLYCLFKDYRPGMVYAEEPLFYEDWDMESARMLISCDTEVQNICRLLEKDFDLSYVRPLTEHYESRDALSMMNKIRSIKGFKGLKTPMEKTCSGFIPDFTSRYFTADFPYGLKILIQIASLLGCDVPHLDTVYTWYESICGSEGFDFRRYGIKTYEDLKKVYLV